MSTLTPQSTPYEPAPYTGTTIARQAVVITDIEMSVGALFRFTLKWFIAAIPALIAFYAVIFVVAFVLALVFGGLFHGLHHTLPQS